MRQQTIIQHAEPPTHDIMGIDELEARFIEMQASEPTSIIDAAELIRDAGRLILDLLAALKATQKPAYNEDELVEKLMSAIYPHTEGNDIQIAEAALKTLKPYLGDEALSQENERLREALERISEREHERVDKDRCINPNGITEAGIMIIADEALTGKDGE